MENSSYKSEAQEAYKKFIKSSKGILGLNLKKRENLKSFSEIQKEENAYKVSLRSGEYVNVSDICLVFGGGGHQKAAGALIKGDVDQVKEKILKEVKKALK